MPANDAVRLTFRTISVSIIAILSASAFATSGTLNITTNTKLKEDHVGPIIFAADGLTLNCNGHQVRAPGEQQAILIQERIGATVKNCNITGAGVGLSVILSTGVVVKDNVAFGNEVTGLYFNNSDDVTVKNNVATNNGVVGIDVQFVTNSSVHDNTANNNNFFGYTITFVNDSVIKDNTATGNIAFGFFFSSSSGNLLKHNSACGHQEDLLLDTIVPSANVFKHNTFCVIGEQ